MWIKKSEITALSDDVRSAIDGKKIELRDNKEGALSILKNDINTLVHMKNEQMDAIQTERDLLAEYLADISHQLKTPITSMKIMTELLPEVPEEKQKEFVGNIRISLSRMEWLVNTLLKMARLDSGSVTFTKKTVSTHDLMKTALQPLEILLDVKNQTVEIRQERDIYCDQRWTAEALTNLIKNASEYTPENGKIIIDSGENPIYQWISVTDSGKGLEKEKVAGIFKRFAYSQNENGYGIGLPLAYAIVKSQNGDLEVDGGGRGKGATFTLKFYKR